MKASIKIKALGLEIDRGNFPVTAGTRAGDRSSSSLFAGR